MDNIFLDTSIFINQNYLNSPIIKEFFNLSSLGYLRLITTTITLEEILSNYTKSVSAAKLTYNKGVKDYEKVLRSIHSTPASLPEFNEESFLKLFNAELLRLLLNSKCTILDTKKVDVQKIFNQYFTTTGPFGNGNKKSEFPDAFVLNIIENWAIEQKQDCFIFSNDGDMLKFKHPKLRVSNNFKGYLDERIREIEEYKSRISYIPKVYENSKKVWLEIILNWVNDRLEDTDTYYDYINATTVHDVIDTTAEIISDKYSLVSVEGDYIIIEVTTIIRCKSKILVDDENTLYKDQDTKEWHYAKQFWFTVEEEVELTTIFNVSLKSKNDSINTFDMIEINNGNELEIEFAIG